MGLIIALVALCVFVREKSLSRRVKDLEDDVLFLATEIDRMADEIDKLRNMQIDNTRLHVTPHMTANIKGEKQWSQT